MVSCLLSLGFCAAVASALVVWADCTLPPQQKTQTTTCPTNLNGPFEFPHLIVPVDKSHPDTAYGTSLSGELSWTVASLFNFDIPPGDAGKKCSLVFLFPKQHDLKTSSYTFSGDGRLDFSELNSPATGGTTYNNRPTTGQDYGVVTVAPGNSYSIATFDCPAGQRVGFEIMAAGNTFLKFFQDFNQAPIGLFITKC
ncbi:Uncharacterized protein TPAR_06956 [Tolypocladium paradoxum]|uniref:Ubiquitin 3 binding protein But2 C-terminal domain-containing protein n=1 Tax=Tolypocladium paradoxum TaxID=94208 RepID=A0A2S4KRM8_9HYPO|nr:Uncharacterized protein TPAR_06956 [Tolypocladium paradoxum]